MPYNRQKTIKFEKVNDFEVKILDMNGKEIGQIMSDGSYGDENSIQICGFDKISQLMGCYVYNGKDICLKWNMEKAGKRDRFEESRLINKCNRKDGYCGSCLESEKNCWCGIMKEFWKKFEKHNIAVRL